MSTRSVKALRRQLPMSRDKMDWNKLASYQVGSELTRLGSSLGAAAAAAAASSATSTSLWGMSGRYFRLFEVATITGKFPIRQLTFHTRTHHPTLYLFLYNLPFFTILCVLSIFIDPSFHLIWWWCWYCAVLPMKRSFYLKLWCLFYLYTAYLFLHCFVSVNWGPNQWPMRLGYSRGRKHYAGDLCLMQGGRLKLEVVLKHSSV